MLAKYGDRESFMMMFNPDRQAVISRNPQDCYFGDYPTLYELKQYGENTPVIWLIPQLYNLSEFCNCKDKLTSDIISNCADMIVNEFGYMKVSELLLFFYRLKFGSFGHFYGSIDPMMILSSLKIFSCDRAQIWEKRQMEENLKKLEREKETSITWKEYCKLQENRLRAEGKDREADEWINKEHPFNKLTKKYEVR